MSESLDVLSVSMKLYAVFVTLSREVVDFDLAFHDGVTPFGCRDHVEVSPGNHECNEDCEEWDVKTKEVEDVLHKSSEVFVLIMYII